MDYVLVIFIIAVLVATLLVATVSALAYRYQRNDATAALRKATAALSASEYERLHIGILLMATETDLALATGDVRQVQNDLVACRTALNDKAAQAADLDQRLRDLRTENQALLNLKLG